MRVLEDHLNRGADREGCELLDQNLERPLLLPLRGRLQGPAAVTGRDRQGLGEHSDRPFGAPSEDRLQSEKGLPNAGPCSVAADPGTVTDRASRKEPDRELPILASCGSDIRSASCLQIP